MKTVKLELTLKVDETITDESALFRLVRVIRALALSAFSIDIEHPAIIHVDDDPRWGASA